jgi:hypothetical protein
MGGWKGLFSGAGSTAAGIAKGKAIEEATGVTPVFVTNWPAGGMDAVAGVKGGLGGGAKALMLAGTLGLGSGAAAVTAGLSHLWLKNGGENSWGQGRSVLSGMGPGGAMLGGIYDLTALLTDHFDRPPEVKNDIAISVMFDRFGRAITNNTDPNTSISLDLNRGTWDKPLGVN